MIPLAIALLTFQARTPVVFVRDGRLQIVGREAPLRERSVREPVVSPDGTRVAFWREGSAIGRDELVERRIAGGPVKILARTNLRTPAYGRNGRNLFFIIGYPWELYMVAPGVRPRRIFGRAQGAEDLFSPNWSHGNEALTIHDMKWVYWVRPNGSLVRKVRAEDILGKDAGVTSATTFADRPGNPMLLVYDGEVTHKQPLPRSWEGPGSSIYLYDVVRHERRALLPPEIFADQPRWTKDGKAIVFRRIDAAGTESIWQIGRDGTGLRMLASNGREPGT